jgi:hypothetical protein
LALISSLIRPTLLLSAGGNGFSRLGGEPELPSGVEWPTADVGLRVFLGQLSLAEITVHEGFKWLPPVGWLYFFLDPDRNGFADLVQVIYATDEPGPPRFPPGRVRIYPERRVVLEPRTSAPSLDWLNFDSISIDAEGEDFDASVLEKVTAPPPDDLQHRIGGYPDEIQFECMPLTCQRLIAPGSEADAEELSDVQEGRTPWRMLLQLDSDPELKMEWHDGGRIYVFVREDDSRRGDFSRTAAILQSY